MTYKEIVKCYEGTVITIAIENNNLASQFKFDVKESNFVTDNEIVIVNTDGDRVEFAHITDITDTTINGLTSLFCKLENGTRVNLMPN